MIITKYFENASAIYHKWYRIDPVARPSSIVQIDDKSIRYQFTEGTYPRDWRTVHYLAQVYLWEGYNTQAYNPTRYQEYVYKKFTDVAYLFGDQQTRRITGLINEITRHKYTPVRVCHGDLTLGNCIIPNDERKIVFIDPGHDRDLPCREMDESKIMQSLEGWEHLVSRENTPVAPIAFPAKRVHYVLLMTHYIRLLRHKTQSHLRDFAVSRINSICEVLSWD